MTKFEGNIKSGYLDRKRNVVQLCAKLLWDKIQTSLQDFVIFFGQKGINAYTCAMLITITKDGPPKVCPSSIAVLDVVFACPSWLPQHNIIAKNPNNIIHMQFVMGAKNY
jgi:hypothetical protein